jgi:excinuclease ABC subunit C
VRSWLAGLRGARVELIHPLRGAKAALVRLARDNARLRLRRAGETEIPDSAALEELQEVAALAALPRRVECVDISTSHGRESVGSVVVFVDGRPAKADYRHFKVRWRGTGGEADDFAMMAEVVGRRYRRVKEEGRELPGLLVVDGGRGQLGAARRALAGLGLEALPLVALAKRDEELYFEGRPEPLALQPNSEALRLLMRLRDEAHRFAISFHRSLRAGRARASRLDAIPGLGPARKQVLLKTLGSVARIRRATLEELTAVEGIGPRLAKEIQRALGEREAGP